MKKYFFKIGITYTDKNKLYAAVGEYMNSMDAHLIFEDVGLTTFIELLQVHMAHFNKEHSRCKPLTLDVWKFDDESDTQVQVSGCFSATIYSVKNEW
ncbi:MAG: hypothetical protein JJE55_08125 [Flavobacteriaceae bacterium]|nr:hypothetical protein [Flavobacteriaceae bacterium]